MVIVIMGNENSVNHRDVRDLARSVRVALRSEHVVRPASLFEDWIKDGTETSGEFDIVTSVSKPCCAQVGGITTREEFRLLNRDRWASGVGNICFASHSAPAKKDLGLVKSPWRVE